MMKRILFLFLLLLHVACGAAKKELSDFPSWVHNPYSKYNKTFYFAAVGNSDTKKGAEKDAYANISKIIQTKITSNESLEQEYVEETGKEIQTREQLNQYTNLQTNQTLKNIKIAKTYYDQNEANYYALAYLNRTETANIYENEISDKSIEINNYYQQYQNASDKLQKLQFLKKALSLTQQNQYLNSQLRVISHTGQTVKLPYNLSKLISEKMQLTNTIQVSITPKGAFKEKLKNYISYALEEVGFSVINTNNYNADFELIANFEIQKANLNRKNLFFVNWYLNIDFINNFTKKSELTFNKSGRSGQINLQQAKQRAIMEIENVVKTDFVNYCNNKL